MSAPKEIDRETVLGELEYRHKRPASAEIGWVLDELAELGILKFKNPADDPSRDPIGTVREHKGFVAVKTGNFNHNTEKWDDRFKNGWVILGNGAHEWALKTDEYMADWTIIGAVPGSSADMEKHA